MQPEQRKKPDPAVCNSCSLSDACGGGSAPGGPLSGGRLALRAVLCFVVPIVAAIVAAAVVSGQDERFAAGLGALLVTAGAVAIVAKFWRRRDPPQV